MVTNAYECLVLFDATKFATNAEGTVGQLHASLEKHGAELLASRPWPTRRDKGKDFSLAYAIDGQKKGTYHLLFFKADTQKVNEIQLDFKLNESVLRFMTSNIDAKIYDEMLAVAQDPTRDALVMMRDENAPSEGGGPRGDGEGGPDGDEGGDGEEGGRRPRGRRPMGPADGEGKD